MADEKKCYLEESDAVAANRSNLLPEAIDTIEQLLFIADKDKLSETLSPVLYKAKMAIYEYKQILDKQNGLSAVAPNIIFDITDLLVYFENNRLPTGVQRVQMEVINRILTSTDAQKIAVVTFIDTFDDWVKVNPVSLVNLCNLTSNSGELTDLLWSEARNKLLAEVAIGKPYAMSERQVLCALGSAWHTTNYCLRVRNTKKCYGIYFVPLIYDLIPIVAGQYCDDANVRRFIEFFLGIVDLSDFYLCISEASKRDLIDVTNRIGKPVNSDNISVVALNADFRHHSQAVTLASVKMPSVSEWPYILVVATIELRKNQIGILNAFELLASKHGVHRLPKIIFVGKFGYGSEKVRARIDESADLQKSVVILNGLDDVILGELYKRALFTVYPSFYEGWGLPVTESLCYGKVPLVANNSSLLEAGEDYAVYYETDSPQALMSGMEQLIFNHKARTEKERYIKQQFTPRSWSQISDQISSQLLAWRASDLSPRVAPPFVKAGNYYPLYLKSTAVVWAGLDTAEKYRAGKGWWSVENDCCWSKPSGGEIAFRLDQSKGARLGFELVCPGNALTQMRFCISVSSHSTPIEGIIRGGLSRWVFVDLPYASDEEVVRVHIATPWIDTPDPTFGGDHRSLGIGVKSFFVFDLENTSWRLDFLERVALAALDDLWAFRDMSQKLAC